MLKPTAAVVDCQRAVRLRRRSLPLTAKMELRPAASRLLICWLQRPVVSLKQLQRLSTSRLQMCISRRPPGMLMVSARVHRELRANTLPSSALAFNIPSMLPMEAVRIYVTAAVHCAKVSAAERHSLKARTAPGSDGGPVGGKFARYAPSKHTSTAIVEVQASHQQLTYLYKLLMCLPPQLRAPLAAYLLQLVVANFKLAHPHRDPPPEYLPLIVLAIKKVLEVMRTAALQHALLPAHLLWVVEQTLRESTPKHRCPLVHGLLSTYLQETAWSKGHRASALTLARLLQE